ncbi:MAG: hypothetical protein AAF518_03905 [Spirochaetota bacterium]
MRYLSVLLIGSLFSFHSLFSAVVIDLKTHLSQKISLLPMKIGTAYFLNRMGYTTLGIDEDYAVWLKEYKKTKIAATSYKVEFIVAITKPSFLLEKDAFVEKSFTYQYDLKKIDEIELDNSLLQLLRKKMQHYSKHSYQQAVLGGEMAAKFVDSFVKTRKKGKQ